MEVQSQVQKFELVLQIYCSYQENTNKTDIPVHVSRSLGLITDNYVDELITWCCAWNWNWIYTFSSVRKHDACESRGWVITLVNNPGFIRGLISVGSVASPEFVARGGRHQVETLKVSPSTADKLAVITTVPSVVCSAASVCFSIHLRSSAGFRADPRRKRFFVLLERLSWPIWRVFKVTFSTKY